MCDHRIREAKRRRKEIYIALIDFKNTFGSLSHKAIIDALRTIGAGDAYCALIQDIYSNSKTSLLTAEGLSDAFDVLCGVKRGCALSSILFILTVDVIIKAIQRARKTLHSLMYADDEVVIEDSPADLQRSLDTLVNISEKLGLSIDPKQVRHNEHQTRPAIMCSY